jgi:hypothetical protein
VKGHSDAAWQQAGNMSGRSFSTAVDCKGAIQACRMTTMTELISMLPWALGLVAAAAALTQVR